MGFSICFRFSMKNFVERLQTSPNTRSPISSSLVAQFAYLASELGVLGVVC